MRENRTSGSMSGSGKPSHGGDNEALPEETGRKPTGPAYSHGAPARLYHVVRCSPGSLRPPNAVRRRVNGSALRFMLAGPAPAGWRG